MASTFWKIVVPTILVLAGFIIAIVLPHEPYPLIGLITAAVGGALFYATPVSTASTTASKRTKGGVKGGEGA